MQILLKLPLSVWCKLWRNSQRPPRSSRLDPEGADQNNTEFSEAPPPATHCLRPTGWQPRKHWPQRRKKLAGWGFKGRKQEVMTRDSYTAYKQIFKCTKYNYLFTSVNTSGSHSTPQGVDGQVDSNRMSVSHKESIVSSAELGGSDTGQLGPTYSTGVSNRSYPHSISVTYTTSNRSVTRKTCSGDTGGSGIAIQGSNNGEHTISNEFYLPDLPGQKKGGHRPVINLRALNQYVREEHFKMEGLHLVPDLLQQRDWMVKMDLKDGYLQIPIHPDHQHLLQFIWGQKHFKFQFLPFSLSSAPRVFTKLLKPVVGFLRQIGLRLIVYLDDMLFMHTNKDQLEAMAPLICKIFKALGLMVNTKKSLLNPIQVVEFLGFQINSLTMTFNLPSEKGRKIQQEAANLLKSQSISARHLAVFIGKVVAASRAVTHAPYITELCNEHSTLQHPSTTPWNARTSSILK